jgi:hypothetical protein
MHAGSQALQQRDFNKPIRLITPNQRLSKHLRKLFLSRKPSEDHNTSFYGGKISSLERWLTSCFESLQLFHPQEYGHPPTRIRAFTFTQP